MSDLAESIAKEIATVCALNYERIAEIIRPALLGVGEVEARVMADALAAQSRAEATLREIDSHLLEWAHDPSLDWPRNQISRILKLASPS